MEEREGGGGGGGWVESTLPICSLHLQGKVCS